MSTEPKPKRKPCPGHSRHWFHRYAGYDGGGPGDRSETCVRCGEPNPYKAKQ